SQQVGNRLPWPWVGIGSGVYIPNPGMSVWVFAALAKVFRANSPVELQTALGVFSVLGILLLIPFCFKFIRETKERLPWLYALGLVLVNPFHIVYERKLWPEGFLPFFSILCFMGWWNRSQFWYALLWGLA